MNIGLITSSVSLASETEFFIADHVSSTNSSAFCFFILRRERALPIRRCTSSTPSRRANVTAVHEEFICSSPRGVSDGGGSGDVAKVRFMPTPGTYTTPLFLRLRG